MQPRLPAGGLPICAITVDPELLERLARHPSSDRHVPARFSDEAGNTQSLVGYRGAHTRLLAKKSYHVTFVDPPLVAGEREIHLNAEYLDPSLLRNCLSFHFFDVIGALAPASRHCFLVINEAAAGVYLRLESVDDLFLQRRGLPPGPIYYAVTRHANFSLIDPLTRDAKTSLTAGYKRKCGGDEDDASLRAFLYAVNTVPRADFGRRIEEFVDVEGFLRWLAGAVCTHNFDGFSHNYALYRNTATGLFHLIPWDYDATWGRNCNGGPSRLGNVPIEGFNTLSARMLDVPPFRRRYRRLMEELLETSFTADAMEPVITSLHRAIRPYLPHDPYKRDQLAQFDEEPAFILRFIQARRNQLFRQLSRLDR